MGLRGRLLRMLPTRAHLPLRYAYSSAFGGLAGQLRALRANARPAGVGVDVGAAVGVYSLGLAGFCRRVVAFEPNPRSAAAIRAHQHPSIEVVECALSSGPGEASLFVPREGIVEHPASASLAAPRGDARALRVRKATLDSFDLRDVTVLKVDVEGHEREVLQGAAKTIARERPAMLVEIEQRHLARPMREVVEEILGLGYEGSFLHRGRLQPLESFRPDIHQRQVEGRASRDYVRDFLFTPGR